MGNQVILAPEAEQDLDEIVAYIAKDIAVNHLIALAGRVGVDLKLADFELGSDTPCLLNLQPSGEF